MKPIFISIFITFFGTTAMAQNDSTKIKYHISGYDTTVIKHADASNEIIITEIVSGIKSYNNEPVYKEFEVVGLEQNFNCISGMTIVVSQVFRKYHDLIPAGKYTFGIGWALVSKEGELVNYYLKLPNKFPFENYQENVAATTIEEMNNYLEQELTAVIEKNKIWTAATKNGVPVHAYFDEPIEFSIEIK